MTIVNKLFDNCKIVFETFFQFPRCRDRLGGHRVSGHLPQARSFGGILQQTQEQTTVKQLFTIVKQQLFTIVILKSKQLVNSDEGKS